MILTVTLNAAIDKRYVVEGFQVGEVNRVKECAYTPGIHRRGGGRGDRICGRTCGTLHRGFPETFRDQK